MSGLHLQVMDSKIWGPNSSAPRRRSPRIVFFDERVVSIPLTEKYFGQQARAIVGIEYVTHTFGFWTDCFLRQESSLTYGRAQFPTARTCQRTPRNRSYAWSWWSKTLSRNLPTWEPMQRPPWYLRSSASLSRLDDVIARWCVQMASRQAGIGGLFLVEIESRWGIFDDTGSRLLSIVPLPGCSQRNKNIKKKWHDSESNWDLQITVVGTRPRPFRVLLSGVWHPIPPQDGHSGDGMSLLC